MMSRSCRNCESQDGMLHNMQTTYFTHNGIQVNFSQCYTFCTGIPSDANAAQLICEMCKLQLQNLYTMKHQFLPQLQLASSSTSTTELEIKEEVIEDLKLITDVHNEQVFVNDIKIEESITMTVVEKNKAELMCEKIGDMPRRSRNIPNNVQQMVLLRATDDLLFQCQICLKNYSSKKSLWGHKNVKHKGECYKTIYFPLRINFVFPQQYNNLIYNRKD
jgi:hypothetical protein